MLSRNWALRLKLLACFAFVVASQSYGQIVQMLPYKTVNVVEKGGVAAFTGAPLCGEPGQPNLPCYTVTFLLPPSTDLSKIAVHLENAAEAQVPQTMQVAPALPPTTDGKLVWPANRPIVNGRDQSVYAKDAFFPAAAMGRWKCGALRQYKMVEVQVFPYRYNPVSNKLVVLTGGRLAVYGADGVSAQAPQAQSLAATSDPAALQVQKLIANTSALGQYGAQPSGATTMAAQAAAGQSYCVITNSTIAAQSTQLQNFLQSKRNRGYTTRLVTESSWGGGVGDVASNRIRAWLQANYISLNIRYVLLIGDPRPDQGDVPMKRAWPRHNATDVNDKDAPTDFYYAELTSNWDADGDGYYGEEDDDFQNAANGADRYAEVAVGRIPYYGTMTDLDHILAKIIAYENTPTSQTAWRKHVLLPMKPLDANVGSFELGEAIKDNWIVPNGGSYYRMYDDVSSTIGYPSVRSLAPPVELVPCADQSLADIWKASAFGAAFWSTHGSSTGAWCIIEGNEVSQLSDAYPSFTFQGSCSNSYPEDLGNLGYSLLKNGAINTIGATRESWYTLDQSFENSGSGPGMNFSYARYLYNDKMSAADALNAVRSSVTNPWWTNCLVFNIYGDPEQGLASSVAGSVLPNLTPIASAGLDTTVAINTPYQFCGEGSIDPDNGPQQTLTYTWTQVSGPAATLTNANTSRPTFTPTVVGTYVFRLTIGDGQASASDECTVVVPWPNSVIDIPGRIEVENYKVGGEGVGYHDLSTGNSGGVYRSDNVDLEACNDVGGGYDVTDIETGEWLAFDVNLPSFDCYKIIARVATVTAGAKSMHITLGGQPLGGSINFSTTSGWTDVVLPNLLINGGAYELRVYMDSPGMKLNYLDFVKQVNVAPVSNPGIDRTVYRNQLVTLDGSGSYDPDNGPMPMTAGWWEASGPAVTLGNPNSLIATFTPTVNGVYTFQLSVSDGLNSVGKNVIITVADAPTNYTLTTTTTGQGTVALNPAGGSYAPGTVVTLTATPAAGYVFAGWGGDLTGATTPTAITMGANRTVSATFTQSGLTPVAVVASTASSGTPGLAHDGNVNTRWESTQGVDPQWIVYDLGSAKAISEIDIDWETASAKNYTLEGSNDATFATKTTLVTKTNMTSLQHRIDILTGLTGSYRYYRMYGTARTTVWGYSIWETRFFSSGSGPNQTPVAEAGSDKYGTVGSPVTLDASASYDPDNGPSPLVYTWTPLQFPASVTLSDPHAVKPTFTPSAAGIYTFQLTVSDGLASATDYVGATVSAVTYTLSTLISPAGTGTVTGGGTYAAGTTATLLATPNTGYSFTGWSGDFTGATNPATITMNANKSITATFALKTFTITVSAGANGTISPTGAVNVNYGANAAFTLTPASGYAVNSVLVDNVDQGALTTYTFTNVTANHTIAATFKQQGGLVLQNGKRIERIVGNPRSCLRRQCGHPLGKHARRRPAVDRV